MKERIQKLLANAGVASRRNVEDMILQGRVAVNGTVRTTLPILIEPGRDRVTVDDELVKLMAPTEGRSDAGGPRIYILLNKPPGVFSTNVAQGVQTRAIDLLPPNLPGRVYPVGRLDAESKGLLLLTNDGELTNQLTHPRYGVSKTYRAVVDGYVDAAGVEELAKGIWLADPRSGKGFKTGRSFIKVSKRSRERSVLEITIREGRNRQVRRMLARLGHKVRELTRIKMGPLSLEGLALGHCRPLTGREIKSLHALAVRSAAAAESREVDSREAEPTEPAERGRRSVKFDRPGKQVAAGTQHRGGQPNRPSQLNRPGPLTRPGQPSRPAKPTRPGNPNRPGQLHRAGNTGRAADAHRAGKPDRGGKPERGGNPVRPGNKSGPRGRAMR